MRVVAAVSVKPVESYENVTKWVDDVAVKLYSRCCCGKTDLLFFETPSSMQ